MTSPVSDADLAKKQERVARLRAQVEEANRTRITREQQQANTITMAQLDAEEARLEAELAAAKSASRVGAVKEGASGPLAAAKEEKAVAEAQGAAALNTPTAGEGS
jgi:hypothetical protein